MSIKFNKSKNKEHSLPCARCGRKTNHKVLTSVEDSEDSKIDLNGVEYDSYWYECEFQIIMCMGCNDISFRSTHTNSEAGEYYFNERTGEEDFESIEYQKLYPSRMLNRKMLNDYRSLPSRIREIYDETFTALCNEMSILTGIGIRTLVEAVCNEKNSKGNKLEQKIDDLVKNNILTADGAEILHCTRLLGNKATHETEPLDNQTLEDAMDIVEHLLTGVYILPLKTKKLPKRSKKINN